MVIAAIQFSQSFSYNSILILAAGGASVWAYFRTNISKSTIDNQNDNIKTLQDKVELLKDENTQMKADNAALRAEMNVIKTIPLQSLGDSMASLANSQNQLLELVRGMQGGDRRKTDA